MADDMDLLRELPALGGGESSTGEYTGMKALMLAVLEDGMRSYCGRAGPVRNEAEDWVRSNHRAPFSFLVICETLGLEPDAVRKALPALQTQLVRSRIRPNVRRGRRELQSPK